MPRFSENEKAIIQEKLFTEGQRLFSAHGLKKVAVDDLVKATGIAKGSFYGFYTNKEHLYMDIIGNEQQKIWLDTQIFLEENKNLSPRELTKKVFTWAFSQMQKNPILLQHDSEITEYLIRKLPKEVMEAHAKDDEQELNKLLEYGVNFKYDIEVVAKILQSVAMTLLSLVDKDDASKDIIAEILVSGVVNEIVSDD